MNYHREFEIAWFGLAMGLHEYQYKMDAQKLALLGYPEIEGIEDYEFDIRLKFDKKSSFFILKFEIDGKASTRCDRCGDDLNLEIWDEFDLIVKLTNEDNLANIEEDDEGDVVFISRNETVIDISEWIYEFIQLSIPIQKVHKVDEQNNSTCNPKALAILAALSTTAPEDQASQEPPTQDPKDIWKDLGKFKF